MTNNTTITYTDIPVQVNRIGSHVEIRKLTREHPPPRHIINQSTSSGTEWGMPDDLLSSPSYSSSAAQFVKSTNGRRRFWNLVG